MSNKLHAIKAKKIIQNTQNGDKDTIVFSNDTIIEIGNLKTLEKDYSFDYFEELENTIITPGFVNAHTHSIQTFFRGMAENLQLLDWLNKVILPGEASLSGEEVHASSLLGFMDMISHGTTFANDMITTHHSDLAIQAATDIGMRVKIGKLLMDIGPDNLVDDTTVAVEETYQLIEKFHNRYSLMEYSINPRFLVSCSSTLMEKCSNFINEDPTLSFHTHACENRKEIQQVKKIHGNYIDSLFNYGNLGNRSILAHGVWLDSHDQNILASTNTAIAHCPSSNAKLASGICDWLTLVKKDIPVAIGTDGPPSNNSMDMFREMRETSFFQRLRTLDETIATSQEVFDLATSGGANALRRPDLGTLEKGKKADFIAIDISQPYNFPIHDYINHIVFKSCGRDVFRTYIGGELVYERDQQRYDKMFPFLSSNLISKVLNIASSYVENKSWTNFAIKSNK